jgi:hypothetical protein
MATAKKAEQGPVEIKAINIQTAIINIEGVTPLICHNWSEKAKKMMLDKQMGAAKTKRPLKDPQEDYISSLYIASNGKPGFPAAAFKAAIVGACRQIDGLPMTVTKVAIRVNGDILPIEGEHRMREDMVRLETGVADLRYRAEFPLWKMEIPITFNADVISPEMLVNLVNLAGMGGVGEWRPSSPKSASGSFGCFRVVAG